MKKLLSLLLAMITLVSVFSGCAKKETVEYGEGGTPANILADTVSDSSELPDWTGKKLELTLWHGAGQSSVKRGKKATEDVVTPEIFRVTGVKYAEDSYDNGDESMDAKLAKLAATKNWPEILEEPESSVLEKLIQQDLIWDLTEYIPKYMPHLQALLDQGGKNPFFKSPREDGKIYWFQIEPNFSYRYPDMDPALIARSEGAKSHLGFVYVRDDILKKIYPDALMQDDLDKIYMENGEFTKEQILDTAFNSVEEFYDFLYKVKDLNLMQGNRKVYPTYAYDGTDNWMLLTYLGCLYGRYSQGFGGANYFTYYDKETKGIEYMFKQDDFKESVKDWVKLVQDDVASVDSLIDNRASFEEKVASGQYAVLYGGGLPGINTINEQGNPYKYRKVYINIPVNQDKYLVTGDASGGYRYAIMKPNVSEEDLIQILQYFDFMLTDVGSKLGYWGPKSAGLFTEDENGNRTYVDPELADCMLYDEPNDKSLYYGLKATPFLGYPFSDSKFDPKITCELDPARGNAMNAFNIGMVERVEATVAARDSITELNKQGIDEVTTFWNARTAFETAMTKVFTAKSDAEFETLYAKVIETAETNGLTDDLLPKLTDIYLNRMNKDYADNLK